MSFVSLLIHTCDVGIFTQGTKDNYGTPAETWPTAGYTSLACRLVPKGGKEIRVGARVLISDAMLFIDDSVPVDAQDRISNIILTSSGAVIDSATYEVLVVNKRRDSVSEHHKELELQKIT